MGSCRHPLSSPWQILEGVVAVYKGPIIIACSSGHVVLEVFHPTCNTPASAIESVDEQLRFCPLKLESIATQPGKTRKGMMCILVACMLTVLMQVMAAVGLACRR